MTFVSVPRCIMAILIGTMLLLPSAFIIMPITSVEASTPSASSMPIDHDAIAILNETDLHEQAATEGWPGTGTAADPIVIEGLNITSDASPAPLYIQRVESHVLIRNCSIESTGYDGNATAIINSANLTFEYVDMVADSGLRAFACHDIVMRNCSVTAGFEYMLEESFTLDVDECVNFTLVGCQIDQAFVYTRAYFHLVEGLNVTGNVIEGTCLSVLGCEAAHIADNTIQDVDTFGLYLFYVPGTEILRNEIIDCDTGMLIYDTDFESSPGMSVDDNVLVDCALLLQAGESTVSTMEMTGNMIDGAPLTLIKDTDLHGGEIAGDACEYVLYEVRNGTLSDREFDVINAICMVSCDNITVRDCDFTDIRGYGVTLMDTDRISVVDCSFSNTNDAVFSYGDSSNLIVSGCEFDDCIVAISDFEGVENEFTGNTIVDGKIGIRSACTIENRIVDNVISGSTDTGIVITGQLLVYDEGATVEGNHLYDCSMGIMFGISKNSTTSGNVIESCEEYGILIHQMNSNITLHDNVITGCEGEAVSLGVAGEPPDFDEDANHDVLLYRNAFIDNNGTGAEYDPDHVQVYTSPFDTVEWSMDENGTTVGNFWSDLTGPDADHDGFVDVPYRTGEDSSDPRPFASLTPYEPTGLESSVTDGRVDITWDAPQFVGMSDVVSYGVWRSDDGSWVRIASVDCTAYSDANVTDGEHRYHVTAENAFGEGLPSEEMSVDVRSSLDGVDVTLVAAVAIVAVVMVAAALVLSRKR